MADFGRILRALDLAAPELTRGHAFESFVTQGVRIASDVADADAVGVAVQRFMLNRDSWSGTAEQLLRLLRPLMEYHDCPRVPNRLTGRLNRLAPALRAKGYEYRSHKSGERTITIEKLRDRPPEPPIAVRAGGKGDSSRKLSAGVLRLKVRKASKS